MVPLPAAPAREAMLRKHLSDRVADNVNFTEVILRLNYIYIHASYSVVIYSFPDVTYSDCGSHRRIQWSRC